MSFLKNIFGSKKQEKTVAINTNADFWAWFQQHEKEFYTVVKNHDDVNEKFINRLAPVLRQLNEELFFLAGMIDATTAELVITADGKIGNFVLVEDLAAAAPAMAGWRITAHKPAINVNDLNIDMAGCTFTSSNLSFYANELPGMPDEIDLCMVHSDYTEDNHDKLMQGCYIYLDNMLGELRFANLVDNLTIIPPADAKAELIPITKLSAYLDWRQKKFVEKYEGTRHNTQNDNYTMYEATANNGMKIIAPMNAELLKWDAKASHPWMMAVIVKYDGSKSNGMPDQKTAQLSDLLEQDIEAVLKDADGYLNIGRQTGNNARIFYFACTEFRKPSRVLHQLIKQYKGKLDISFELYKDKYWQSLNRLTGTGY